MNKQPNLKNPIHFLALGFGSGLLKPAPGTWGSLAGLILAICLWQLIPSSFFFMLLTLVSFVAGCHICSRASEDFGLHDDGRIVWDEIVAIFLMFAFLPHYNLTYYLLAFASFRLFDILKPYPIKHLDERLESGLGIMVDDILAAVYALLSLYLIDWIF
ncbi:phosphatidylglycerophosphatase [Pasteurellaceae bacterium RH1A]|nr:phosphatidylglycerophosphatase [Pasteurellaceae bacterium RH1A]